MSSTVIDPHDLAARLSSLQSVDDPDGVPFYYRIHSPVILIEFDHHSGVCMANDEPEPFHIHTIVRTPNGNDYGMDLLRQHYALIDHPTPA